MRVQKSIFIVIATIIIIGSFYFLFRHDLKNIPTVLKIVVDKDYYDDVTFYEDLRKEFINKNENVSIKYIYLNHYAATEYIAKNDIDAWFTGSEENIESLKSRYGYNDKNSIQLQSTIYATSPMIIMGWRDKLDKLGDIEVSKLYDIVANNESWSSFGGDAKWGKIKFDHANPAIYDSGTRFVALLTNNYNSQISMPKKFITKHDVSQAKDYIIKFEKNVDYKTVDNEHDINAWINYESGSKDMILLDEHILLKNIENAHTKWSDFKIAYLNPNVNVNIPFVIVEPSKYSKEKADLMSKFKEFLLGEDIQKKVLESGFRPVNTNIKELQMLESEYYDFGFRKDIFPSTLRYDREVKWSISDIIDEIEK